jgi:hypothetical protein
MRASATADFETKANTSTEHLSYGTIDTDGIARRDSVIGLAA